MNEAPIVRTRRSIRLHLLAGLAVGFFLTAGVGGLAATMQLSGAVIADGVLVVDSHVKVIRPPHGGVVDKLRVEDGDMVRAGEILLTLDTTEARANLTIISNRFDELSARYARLLAERDGSRSISFPEKLLSESNDRIKYLTGQETRLFKARRSSREGQKAQLKERISQLEKEIDGLNAQIEAKIDEIALIHSALAGVRDLWKQGLAERTRLNALQRDAARLEGERGALVASVARTRGEIAETRLQILEIGDRFQNQVAEQIGETGANMSELAQRKIAAEEQLRRTSIRSPQDGVIQDMSVHMSGAVVAPDRPLMTLVPIADPLTAEVRIAPKDIDQLSVGQSATLRFEAFDRRTTPQVQATVRRIAANRSQDPNTGRSYYTVRLALSQAQFDRLGPVELVAGMPVQAFIKTGKRTILSYLVKPFADQLTRTFRED